MRDSSTRCTHTTCFDLHAPNSAPDEKLAFVEHVLGVLIESRYGNSNPYTRLVDQPVTTGLSQMFANITLLTAAEIEARLRSADRERTPFYADLLRELPLAKAVQVVAEMNRRLKSTAIPFDRASPTLLQTTNLARGSPDIPGTFFFASSFASLASFA